MGEAARKQADGTVLVSLRSVKAKRAASQRVYEPAAIRRRIPLQHPPKFPAAAWSVLALLTVGVVAFLAIQVADGLTAPADDVVARAVHRDVSTSPLDAPVATSQDLASPPHESSMQRVTPFPPLTMAYAPYTGLSEWQRAQSANVTAGLSMLTSKVEAIEDLILGSPFNEAIRNRLAEASALESQVEAANARVAKLEATRGTARAETEARVELLAQENRDLRRRLEAVLAENQRLKARPALPGWRVAGVSPDVVAFQTPAGGVKLVRPGEQVTAGVKLLSVDLEKMIVRTSAGDLPAPNQ